MYNNLLHLFSLLFVDYVDQSVDNENGRDCPRGMRGAAQLLAICGQCGQ
jgi:hypothetical protein